MACWIACLIAGTIGWFIGWFMKPSNKQAGDLSMEGEGALRAEADSLRARVQDLEGRVSARDTEVASLKTQLAAAEEAPKAPEAAANVTAKTSDSDETYALEWQNRYLAARVKYLDSRLAELGDAGGETTTAGTAAAATAASKAKPAAKPKAKTAKAAPAKKAPAKKATSTKKKEPAKAKTTPKAKAAAKPKATTAKAKSTTAKKSAPKKKSSGGMSKEEAAFERYYTKVKMYDARASRTVVQNIVNYCGVSLKSRDSSLVACSDEAELTRVAKGFVTKKLGLEDGQMELVKSVCEQMKDQRLKSRVTFYYLAAKKARKLSLFK